MKAPVGLLSGRAVLRSKMEGLCPDKLGGICDKGYHGLQSTSRWFCKFYCSKAVIVGLIAVREHIDIMELSGWMCHTGFYIMRKNHGCDLVIMSSPRMLTQSEYDVFFDFLKNTVMKNAY